MLIDSIRYVNVTPLSLPNDRSYARCNCASIHVPQDPFFENFYTKSTLVNEDPEELSLYQHPDHQPPPFKLGACQRNNSLFYTMSSSIPSAGDDNLKGKTRVTNNSASWDLVTPLTTRRKGKGVSMTEELDPEALSPMNHSPMPASGPILSGPHTLDNVVSEETSMNPAASPSASRLPSSSKATSRIPAAPKSVNNAKLNSLNRGARKASTMGVNQLAAQDQQSRKEPLVTIQTSTEDLLNLKAAIQYRVKDDKTQTSLSSQTEEDETETATVDRDAMSEFNTIFWDIEAIKDLPVWAEPITTSTDCLFGAFDPAANEDILVPLGAIDRILPGQTKYECDRLRSAIELVYKTPTDCWWDDLGSAIHKFTAHEVSKKDLVKYTGPQLVHGIFCWKPHK